MTTVIIVHSLFSFIGSIKSLKTNQSNSKMFTEIKCFRSVYSLNINMQKIAEYIFGISHDSNKCELFHIKSTMILAQKNWVTNF